MSMITTMSRHKLSFYLFANTLDRRRQLGQGIELALNGGACGGGGADHFLAAANVARVLRRNATRDFAVAKGLVSLVTRDIASLTSRHDALCHHGALDVSSFNRLCLIVAEAEFTDWSANRLEIGKGAVVTSKCFGPDQLSPIVT